jgi:hypothetical protein
MQDPAHQECLLRAKDCNAKLSWQSSKVAFRGTQCYSKGSSALNIAVQLASSAAWIIAQRQPLRGKDCSTSMTRRCKYLSVFSLWKFTAFEVTRLHHLSYAATL